ncbi:MAG: hypothetical protein WB820_06305, partial [Rhodoplanes sp.]
MGNRFRQGTRGTAMSTLVASKPYLIFFGPRHSTSTGIEAQQNLAFFCPPHPNGLIFGASVRTPFITSGTMNCLSRALMSKEQLVRVGSFRERLD